MISIAQLDNLVKNKQIDETDKRTYLMFADEQGQEWLKDAWEACNMQHPYDLAHGSLAYSEGARGLLRQMTLIIKKIEAILSAPHGNDDVQYYGAQPAAAEEK